MPEFNDPTTGALKPFTQPATGPSVVSPLQPTGQGNQVSNISQSTPMNVEGTQVDPSIVALMHGLKKNESPNGDYNAIGDQGTAAGIGQWSNQVNGKVQPLQQGQIPTNFANDAKQFGLNPTDFSPENQNKVMYAVLEQDKKNGLTPEQALSKWNSGDPNKYQSASAAGTGQVGAYDVAGYVQRGMTAAQQYASQNAQNAPVAGVNQPAGQTPQDPSVGGFLGNVVSSGANFAGNLVNAAIHPLQTVQNIGSMAAGGLQELGGQTNDNTAKFDQLKEYLGNRYGSISNLEHTIYSDPVGFAADLSTVLGTGAGVAGLGAKAAELGGLGEVGSVATETAAATEASGLAGGLKATAGALGTGAKYTNPLTPVVAGGSALLNQTKKLSDVIANPKDYTPENIAAASSEKITQDVQDAFDAKRATLSETGSGYAPFRETPTAITTAPAQLDNILRDSLKVDVTDGVIKPTSTSLLRDTTSINKLQGVYNTYKTDFLNGSMDSEKLLNLRTDLAKIAYNDLGIKNSDVATLAAKVRGVVNDTYRSQVPGLSELDTSYSSQLNDLNDLQDGLIYKTGSNKGELKTSFINGATKAIKNGDTDKLAQLEQIVPGITRRLEIMKSIKDLGNPDFTVSLLEKGGLAQGLLTGNIKTMALAATTMILSKPTIAVPLMRALGANLDLVKQVMANLSKSITAGASLNNVEQAIPQSQGENLAKTPTQTPNQPLETQNGNSTPVPLSSDLTSLASSKNFDLTAARKAGYSDQDIQQFLQTQ